MHHTHTHTERTVSIIHAYSHDYATVNPSVLPWRCADGKDKGEGAVHREMERGWEGESVGETDSISAQYFTA